MKIVGTWKANGSWRLMLLVLLAMAGSAVAQAQVAAPLTVAQTPPAPASRDQLTVAATIHGTLKLDGGWRFRVGDDPAWADPAFDDSKWDKINVTVPLVEQGIESYSGYGWYRLRLHPVPAPESGQLALSLLVVPNSVGQVQVFANGVELSRSKGMTDIGMKLPTMYQSTPMIMPLGRLAPDGTVVIAVRTWAEASIGRVWWIM